MIWLLRELHHLRSEHVPASRHSLQYLLIAILQRATQLEGTLHQRVIGDKGVGPYSLHQFLLTDQPSRMFHQIFKSFINLGAKFDFPYSLENTPPCEVQCELAKLIG